MAKVDVVTKSGTKVSDIEVRTVRGSLVIVGHDLADLDAMVRLAHRLGFKGWS